MKKGAGGEARAEEEGKVHRGDRRRAAGGAGRSVRATPGVADERPYLPCQTVPARFTTGTPTELPYSVHEPS